MKSILEVSPTEKVLYEMPDGVYEIVNALFMAYPWVYHQKPTMDKVLAILPSDVRGWVTARETDNRMGLNGVMA